MSSSSKRSYIGSWFLICIFGLLSIFVIHAFLVRGSTEKYVTSLMQDYRRDLISGSRTAALQKLKNKLGSDFGFVEIAYTMPGNQTKFLKDAYAERKNLPFYERILNGSIDSSLYYDSENTELAIAFSFYYRRFIGFMVSFLSWIIFCGAIAITLRRFYVVNRKAEDIRNAAERSSAIANVVQALSHDMRAPLGIFERLLFLDSGSTIEKYQPMIRESLNRLTSMIESLRRSETEVLINRQQTKIIFDHGFEGLSYQATKRGIKLHDRPRFERIVVLDGGKFERAWVNLASNAIDFARSEVRIEVEISGLDLFLKVIDDGPGVPEEFQPKLFQRGATHGKADGTGLGLAYVRQIMRGHGGDVTYRRENNLTIFECRLPNAVVQEEEQALNNTASLEIRLSQRVIRKVAICLHPPELSKAVLARMSSLESEDFFFTEERDDVNVVVSNVEDIMIEVLEADDKEFVAVGQLKGDEDRIVDILKRKFNLV